MRFSVMDPDGALAELAASQEGADAEGHKDDEGKPRMSLLPIPVMELLQARMGIAAGLTPTSMTQALASGQYLHAAALAMLRMGNPDADTTGTLAVLQVLEYGATKYGEGNWRKVENAEERYLDAAWRHLLVHFEGEDAEADATPLDDDSGLPHLAHLACCCLFLEWFSRHDNYEVDP